MQAHMHPRTHVPLALHSWEKMSFCLEAERLGVTECTGRAGSGMGRTAPGVLSMVLSVMPFGGLRCQNKPGPSMSSLGYLKDEWGGQPSANSS